MSFPGISLCRFVWIFWNSDWKIAAVKAQTSYGCMVGLCLHPHSPTAPQGEGATQQSMFVFEGIADNTSIKFLSFQKSQFLLSFQKSKSSHVFFLVK